MKHTLYKAFVMALATLLMAVCTGCPVAEVDRLNELSYRYHYRNLDSTRHYALAALALAGSYDGGRAEAVNNLAFVDIARMRYADASRRLDSLGSITGNEIELLVGDVQMMRLCQRQSQNKSFYEYNERARTRIRRIAGERFALNSHETARFEYAESEYRLVASAYYYYLGLTRQSVSMIHGIDPNGAIRRDTAQLLGYWYNIGSGGIIQGKTQRQTAREEFDYLVGCYALARQGGYPYWEAQALQALSEHLQEPRHRQWMISDNYPSILYVNTDGMPDSLLAGNLAQRSHDMFARYGDVYQTAGSLRTLAECYWHIADYGSALACLKKALGDKRFVDQAPDLVASIREQLCLVYSAVDDKPNSDRNRNIYLDLQEKTRQDRQLEARAAQLDRSSMLLNLMISVVVLAIVAVMSLLMVFARMRRRSDESFSMKKLLEPLRQWQKQGEKENSARQEHMEEIGEETEVARLHLQQNRRRNLEQRAKVQLVNSVLPLIDRMVNEVGRLERGMGSPDYISALTDNINQNNNVLTQWIQMRQGEVSLHIENFPLQQLFDILAHGSMSFKLKGISLTVKPTDTVVKADRVLTLFMLNTIADNARKFTPEGGQVTIEAKEVAPPIPAPNSPPPAPTPPLPTPSPYVEISISDNGKGMDEATLAHIFDRTYTGGHGFGLKNCNGIIEKYKKLSRLFSVCAIGAKSKVDTGTRIFFRLPTGKLRTILAVIAVSLASLMPSPAKASLPAEVPEADHDAAGMWGNVGAGTRIDNRKAAQFADSAYLSNVMGHYERTVQYADSCLRYISRTDTATLLDISNETAVAALALHRWNLYHASNRFYTHLFREASADSSLPQYVRAMQRNNSNKTVAVVLLVILLLVVFPAYYFLYYRHKLNYKFCVERIRRMNDLLFSDISDSRKLEGIRQMKDFHKFNLSPEQRQSLNAVVGRIEKALAESIANRSEQETQAELATDELNRLRLDSDKLYISNSVLDNCLSTLKHETMYYPSRIRQLIDTGGDLQALKEVVDYYHDLYAILAEQATRQASPQRIDAETVGYMLEILKKRNGGEAISIATRQGDAAAGSTPSAGYAPDARYTLVEAGLGQLKLTPRQLTDLFMPSTVDVNFLLCRQIVREMGEATNLRACGISARMAADGSTIVDILMPRRYAMAINPSINTQ